jgi:hypothetical protein
VDAAILRNMLQEQGKVLSIPPAGKALTFVWLRYRYDGLYCVERVSYVVA